MADRDRTPRRRPAFAPLLALLAAAAASTFAACDTKQGAMGDANSIVTAADPELWQEIQDSVYGALEPTIQTVRNEKTFTVTYQDPEHELWSNLRKFRQMLLIGTQTDSFVVEALAESDRTSFSPPEIVQVYDVWARNQLVTVLLLPEEDPAGAAVSMLDELHQLYDRQYREFAVNRMFLSGRDSALADTLFQQAGFWMLFPTVYKWDRQDSLYVFRNDNPSPDELIREVTVTWRSPIPPGMQPEDLLQWRAEISDQRDSFPQEADLSLVEAGPFTYRGHDAYQIQAQWVNPPEADWPAAGPFILRSILCRNQDRMYLVDAWLYAPEEEKYQYMIQLQTILDSFRCGAPGAGGGGGGG